MLINTVIFAMVSYWASIFILPAEVIDFITQLCRNFLWNGSKVHHIQPRKQHVCQKIEVDWGS